MLSPVAYPVPLLWEVQTKKYLEGGGTNSHGSQIDVWADPVSQRVYGWSVPDSREPKVAGHDRVTVRIELLVPPAFDCGPYDKVIVPGHGELDAIGDPEDFNHGPFGFQPGFVVNLGKVDG